MRRSGCLLSRCKLPLRHWPLRAIIGHQAGPKLSVSQILSGKGSTGVFALESRPLKHHVLASADTNVSRNRDAAELAFSEINLLVLRIGHFRLSQQPDRRVDGTNCSGQGDQRGAHLG